MADSSAGYRDQVLAREVVDRRGEEGLLQVGGIANGNSVTLELTFIHGATSLEKLFSFTREMIAVDPHPASRCAFRRIHLTALAALRKQAARKRGHLIVLEVGSR